MRWLQHIMVVLFLLSFTNQASDLAGGAIWPIRLAIFMIASFAMYLWKKPLTKA
ncbi:hypothetical protein H9X85_02765 [Anaerotignum lactatifermentans]|uniref:Uncharacterized protein n=1 Tax=Anaerotignum lactatifermentans TaxID=160404 RepID=A0ABS2GBH9_9FIRM|nr:hypothetical protein [Anaerotignum lactatifermentans]MBM6828555.1 hypothetical protein [Anaerotignum lactatifermentans]MBM6877962.1 hypothetical protein [Anaerotignum lactatifermentans]MBM6950137.1 hypothetical protein [Anaerotignum lactatifermentans]